MNFVFDIANQNDIDELVRLLRRKDIPSMQNWDLWKKNIIIKICGLFFNNSIYGNQSILP